MIQINVSQRSLSAIWQLLNDEKAKRGIEAFDAGPLATVYKTVYETMCAEFFAERRKQDAARAARKVDRKVARTELALAARARAVAKLP